MHATTIYWDAETRSSSNMLVPSVDVSSFAQLSEHVALFILCRIISASKNKYWISHSIRHGNAAKVLSFTLVAAAAVRISSGTTEERHCLRQVAPLQSLILFTWSPFVICTPVCLVQMIQYKLSFLDAGLGLGDDGDDDGQDEALKSNPKSSLPSLESEACIFTQQDLNYPKATRNSRVIRSSIRGTRVHGLGTPCRSTSYRSPPSR